MKLLSESPRILTIDSFLTPEEIEELITIGRTDERESTVVDGQSGEVRASSYRVCKITYLDPKKQSIVSDILIRLAAAAKCRPEQIEGLQILRYPIGGHYFPHVDPFDSRNPLLKKSLTMGGQRIASVIIGLKKADKGGETDFNKLRMSVLLEPGQALMFWSLHADGMINYQTEHSAMPVLEGEKIVLVTWIRERKFDGSEEVPEPLNESQLQRSLDHAKKTREIECDRALKSALEHFNCKLENTSEPILDPITGEIHVRREIRIVSQ
jgi:prolyl 4-hydroxylase